MFGLIVKFVSHAGKRDELIRILSTGFQNMEGCHSYIIASDPAEENSVWITEIWDSDESHEASLAQPNIQAVIADATAKKVLAGREMRVVTKPVGGQGLFRDDAWRPERSTAADR